MNKIIYYLFFFSLFSYAQKELNQAEKIKDRIQKEACEKTFVISGSYYYSEIYLIKNNRNFYFKQNNNNEILSELICNGEYMWSINYEFEELTIYSLTEKEKEDCFFVEKVTNKIDEIKIDSSLILIEVNNDWIILEESDSNNIEDCALGTYDVQKLQEEYNIIGNINLHWIESPSTVYEHLPPGFNFKLNINRFLQNNEGFEIIDFR